MNKKITFITSVSLVAILFVGAVLPAFAQTNIATGVSANVSAGVSANGTSVNAGSNATAAAGTRAGINISDAKNKADTAVTARITSLNDLLTRLAAMVKVSASTKASISATVQTEITDMTNLKAQIDADTSTTTLKTDIQSITKSYRIYLLVLPQGRLTALADRVDTIVGMMTTIGGKFQTRITAAQSAGDNVSTEVSLLADYNAKISDAQTQANAAEAEIAPLQPDNGSQTVLQSNNATLADARAKLKISSSDLVAARQDAGTLLSDLKALNVSTSATTTASTQ